MRVKLNYFYIIKRMLPYGSYNYFAFSKEYKNVEPIINRQQRTLCLAVSVGQQASSDVQLSSQ